MLHRLRVWEIFAVAISGKIWLTILDTGSLQVGAYDLMRHAQIFQYANGKDRPPTAIDLDKSLMDDLLFNQSPGKVSFSNLQSYKQSELIQSCYIIIIYYFF